MDKVTYPKGVENHGGTLRIWFTFKGKRVRENLGVPDTAKNRKIAGELRTSVCFAIKMGSFDYVAQFPDSTNLKAFGLVNKEITIGELSQKWLSLKEMEVAKSSMTRYRSAVKNMLLRIDPGRQIATISREDVLIIRKELLTGYQIMRKGQKKPVKGCSVPTVNYYISIMSGICKFAIENGYLQYNPFEGLSSLKRSKPLPDPLTREEFIRLIEDGCLQRQIKNLWSLAVYTGMRHGEICGLSWEDIDLKAGTLMVRRNHTKGGEFTLPKTDAGTDRVIHLIKPAIDILKDQAELTRLGKQHQVEVKLREYGRSTIHPCTFVFNPQFTKRNNLAGYHYAVNSINKTWESAMRRAGLRYRKAYQSRHTYACWSLTAGANPSFVANQMGHANAQMVYQVYGTWMPENNAVQVALLNKQLSDFAPTMPQRASGR